MFKEEIYSFLSFTTNHKIYICLEISISFGWFLSLPVNIFSHFRSYSFLHIIDRRYHHIYLPLSIYLHGFKKTSHILLTSCNNTSLYSDILIIIIHTNSFQVLYILIVPHI